jgi:methyltransferase
MVTAWLSDSRILFSVLIAAVALQRLVELAISARHRRALLARGGVEVGAGHYPAMVALHIALLLASPAEVWLLSRPWQPWLGWSMLAVLAAAQLVRVWTMASLGDRWMTRVVVVPGDSLIDHGPYRWMRHPNYLVVAVEVAAIPLIHGAWLTATSLSVANLLLLATRIRTEEAALREHTEYDTVLGRGEH